MFMHRIEVYELRQIGRKIFYDVSTGDVLVNTGEKVGNVIETTLEQDIQSYSILTERTRHSFDVLDLPFGAYSQDFAECNDIRINPNTKAIEFSYPDPTNPEAPSVFQKPLSVEVEELKIAQAATDTTLLELMETILLA